ncbi:hypothetical protein B0T12DRAFT_394243 [Alternaria alternata]|nr:hypothetical protein B0T12DRAFT_394243 [Alternaria alternata]
MRNEEDGRAFARYVGCGTVWSCLQATRDFRKIDVSDEAYQGSSAMTRKSSLVTSRRALDLRDSSFEPTRHHGRRHARLACVVASCIKVSDCYHVAPEAAALNNTFDLLKRPLRVRTWRSSSMSALRRQCDMLANSDLSIMFRSGQQSDATGAAVENQRAL